MAYRTPAPCFLEPDPRSKFLTLQKIKKRFGRIGQIRLTEFTGFDIFFKPRDCVKFIHDSISIKGETI